MFTGLIGAIWEEFARYIFHVEVEYEGADGFQQQQTGPSGLQFGGGSGQPSALAAAAAGVVPGEVSDAVTYGDDGEVEEFVQIQTRHVDEKDQIGRNDPCWCGSGKKFKKCHGA
jgi:preprotein translocase subunit SecA